MATRAGARRSSRRGREERFLLRPDRAVLLAAGLLAAFVLMALLVPDHPLELEQRWADLMEDIRTPVLEHVALVFNAAGRWVFRAPCLLAIGIVLVVCRRWLALLALAAAETLSPLAVGLTKAEAGRPRPPDGLVHAPGSAFPSGHAAYAGVTCVALVLLFTTPGPRRRFWWALAALGIAAMAWSRTYLEVHWALDVVAGSLLGVGVALLAFGLAQTGAARRRRRSTVDN